MAAQNLTEYERRRLENIKRNDEMLTSLKIHPIIFKRKRDQSKSNKANSTKKEKSETSIGIRQSLRARGQPPDAATVNGLKNQKKSTNSQPLTKASPLSLGPISMRDACISDDYGIGLAEKILSRFDVKLEVSTRVRSSTNDLDLLKLKPEYNARVSLNRIISMKFLPSIDVKMVVAGDKCGYVCIWDIDSENGGNGIYQFRPHSWPVSGIAVQSFSLAKVFTSCHDGFVRMMDLEKEVFDLVYSSDSPVYSLGQPNDRKSLYFGEGQGVLNVWDNNAGKSSNSWTLHISTINTIDFNPANSNVMATSSSDGTACIWDLRKMNEHKPQCLQKVTHERTVHSAYFSPSGSCLATTSYDDKIGLSAGATFENLTMIPHANHTADQFSSLRAIWGWDDSYIFVSNLNKGVGVISTEQKRTVATLQTLVQLQMHFVSTPTHTMLGCSPELIVEECIFGLHDTRGYYYHHPRAIMKFHLILRL